MFDRKTVRDVDLAGKTILLHGEFDAPLDSQGQKVTSDFRIFNSLPTIKYLQDQNCRIIAISKLGRPGGKVDPKKSLLPVAKCLSDLLGQEVGFVDDCIGAAVKKAASSLQPKGIILLENLRFHTEEEANDIKFAKKLAEDSGAELFVQDCFALVHRKEVGTDAITKVLPSVAGLHLEKEVDTITNVMEHPDKPLLAILGGAKIDDKVEVLHRFINIADSIAVGGALANTFLAAQGLDVADSLYDKGRLHEAQAILKKAEAQGVRITVPVDAIVANAIEADAKTRTVEFATGSLKPGEKILDIGPASAELISQLIQDVHTVVWNGTMGVTEFQPFTKGTEAVIKALTKPDHKPSTLVGGGDTTGYLESHNLVKDFAHVSTGGGASLDLMSGRPLPGVDALLPK